MPRSCRSSDMAGTFMQYVPPPQGRKHTADAAGVTGASPEVVGARYTGPTPAHARPTPNLRPTFAGPLPRSNDANAASMANGGLGGDVRPRWHDARMTRRAQYDHGALAKTLDGQLYVVSRSQALACDLTPGALRHRTRPGGPWRTLLPGVYLVDSREPNVMQRDVAATLYAGDGSMITGVAALWRHDIRHPLSDMVDVLVSASHKVQSIGFARVWRTTRLPA